MTTASIQVDTNYTEDTSDFILSNPEFAKLSKKTKDDLTFEKITVTVEETEAIHAKVKEERGIRHQNEFLSWMTATDINEVRRIWRTTASYRKSDGSIGNFWFYDYKGLVNSGDSVTLLFVRSSAYNNARQFIGLRNNTTGESASFLNRQAIRRVVEHQEQKVWAKLIRVQQLIMIALLGWLGLYIYGYHLDTGHNRWWHAYYTYIVPFSAFLLWVSDRSDNHYFLQLLRNGKSLKVYQAMQGLVKFELGENIAVHRLDCKSKRYHRRFLDGKLGKEPEH